MIKDIHLVAANGVCRSNIILSDKPSLIELFAKDELVRYLEILSSGDAPAFDDSFFAKPNIRFVTQQNEHSICYPSKDKFEIRVDESGITMIGSDRALLYSVYELLEYLGARFYFPGEDDNFTQNTNMLSVPFSFFMSKEALVPYRAINLENIVKRDKKLVLDHIDWMAKKRFNILCTHPESYGGDIFSVDIIRFGDCEEFLLPELEKRGIAVNMNVHSTYYFLSPEKYMKEHNDWYALKKRSIDNPSNGRTEESWCANQTNNNNKIENKQMDFFLSNLNLYFKQPIDSIPLMVDNNISPQERLKGLSVKNGIEIATQICYSNMDALQTYCNNIKEYLRNHNYVGILGLWPTDLGGYCECEKCASDPQVIFKASRYIAKELEFEFPDLIVEHLLYMGPSKSMPDENLTIPKNMVILQACGRQEMIDSWLKKCNDDKSLGMYKINYTLANNFQDHGHVCIDPNKTMEVFKYIQEYSFLGYDIMYIDMYSYWRSCHNLSLLAKLSWDAELDQDAYLVDFCNNYYGEAAVLTENVYKKMFKLDYAALFGVYDGYFRLVDFGKTPDSDIACEKNSKILIECKQIILETMESVSEKILHRLKKLEIYIGHLLLYSEVSFQRLIITKYLGKKDIKSAALTMREIAIKEEQIKAMCLDSYFRDDGVLDIHLTLALRKFGRFLDYEDMVTQLFQGLRELEKD